MKYHAPSRRMFLGGAGATLALPLLHSLLPKNAIAATTPLVRYIQVFSAYGASERLFYGSRKGTVTTVSPNVKYQKLTEVQGAISPIFGTEFQSFKSKMTLVRGVDVFARNANHNFCTTTCASSYDAGIDGDHYPPFSGQVSIDALLASSAKVYNVNAPAARRLVALNPGSGDGYTNSRSATWLKTSDGKIAMAAPLKATSAFLDVFASGFGGEGTVDPRENALMSAVWDDYKSVRDSARISSADRRRVDT